MTDERKFPDEIDNNQNKHSIQCQFCNSTILKAYNGRYVESEFKLPLMHQRTKRTPDINTEVLKNYWIVEDMFTFENIGFSNTVENTKYLICADCEMGPIGYHDIVSKKSFVALKRVKHNA